jgi:predicted secreted hydrolase
MRRRGSIIGLVFAGIFAAIVVAACSGGGPILANPVVPLPTRAPAPAPTAPLVDPRPIELPRDDAPHDRLTEWWYYTGHLKARDGRRFGFEYVIFRAERGLFPTSWVAHLAITDEDNDRFFYSQRLEVGPGADRAMANASASATQPGFDLWIAGADPTQGADAPRPPWSMTGRDGTDALSAVLSPDEATAAGAPAGLALDLDLVATKPAVLHDEDGWIDFGPAGGSYYYSRTAMTAAGSLTVDGTTADVTGSAWFDHQWGDFISVGGGGWDWFAVNLEDGTDLTLSLVRDVDGTYPLIYGTLVACDGQVRHLDRDDFEVTVTARWTSPSTGADYPAGWIVELPGDDLTIRLTPTVAAQELDTRATTGVVYWEGSQRVEATYAGIPLAGDGYVELTGYAPASVPGP